MQSDRQALGLSRRIESHDLGKLAAGVLEKELEQALEDLGLDRLPQDGEHFFVEPGPVLFRSLSRRHQPSSWSS